MPSAAMAYWAHTVPMFSTSSTTWPSFSTTPWHPAPSTNSAPSAFACFTSALSNSARGTTAANWPSFRGRGNSTVRPEGDRMKTSFTGIHVEMGVGSSPRPSRSRSAPAVRPSPHALGRGKHARSTITTRCPARARVMAAAQPAGPAPTMAASQSPLIGPLIMRFAPAPVPGPMPEAFLVPSRRLGSGSPLAWAPAPALASLLARGLSRAAEGCRDRA